MKKIRIGLLPSENNPSRSMNTCHRTAAKIAGRSALALLALAGSLVLCRADAPSASAVGQVAGVFSAPARVGTDSQGRLYVTDSARGSVRVVDGFGRLLATQTGFSTPLGVAADSAGNIYVAEDGLGKVTVYDANWNATGQLGSGALEFQFPNYLAIRENAGTTKVYVTDSVANQVRVYQDGTLTQIIGGTGSSAGKFKFPAGLCFNAAGELLVVDQDNDRVQVFDTAGVYVRSFTLKRPGATVRSGRGQGICTDGLGRIFVADSFQGYLRVFAPDGTFLSQLGSYGISAGQFRTPMGIVVDSSGRLFVASANNSRVDVIGLDCFTTLTASPASQVVAVGATAVFSVATACNVSASYQWYEGTNALVDGPGISGSTNGTLTLAGVTLASAGDYSVTVTGTNGLVVSPSATLVVAAAPVITQSPTNQSVAQGGNATLRVSATGQSLAYQWFYQGSAIDGATTSVLALVNVPPTAEGSYYVKVSNPAATVSSASALLTVLDLPYFVQQPAGRTVAEYGSVSFVAIASSSPRATYQWFYNGLVLAGQTNISLAYTSLTPAFNGQYYAVAANTAGSATSQVALLTVVPDTVAPAVLNVFGGRNTDTNLIVSFSESVTPATATNVANYILQGDVTPSIVRAVVSNSSTIILNLNGARTPLVNYNLTVQNVADTAYTPNLLSPNPTNLPVWMQIDLITINGSSWKYLQPTNNVMDAQPWRTVAFDDSTWSNGFGIFYGNRTNSPYQPNPNPNVKLPFALSGTDTNNTRVYTILNVFTNASNAIRTYTYYFRTTFNLPAETNGVLLRIHSIIDDGAVTYINGGEVRRDRMSSGTPVFTTLASSSGSQSWSPAITTTGLVAAVSNLVKGVNTIAVEVHQRTTTDDDMTFGCYLEAIIPSYSTLAPMQISPVAGGVSLSKSSAVVDSLGGQSTVLDSSGFMISWEDPDTVVESATSLTGEWSEWKGVSPLLIPKSEVQSTPSRFFRLRRVLPPQQPDPTLSAPAEPDPVQVNSSPVDPDPAAGGDSTQAPTDPPADQPPAG